MDEKYIQGKIRYKLRAGKSAIHGKGAFAVEAIPARKKIGSLSGIIIGKRAARQKASGRESVSIVELWNGKALDASDTPDRLRFMNHSCNPNTFMRTAQFEVAFYALRAIVAGEELTCNYGPTHHDGTRPCRCGAPGCKGFI